MRTIVSTGVPALAEFAFRDLALADGTVDWSAEYGVFEGLAGEGKLGSALRQHGFTIADFLERVLIPAFAHFEQRFGGVEIGPGRDAALDEGLDAVAREACLVAHGAALTHQRCLLGIDGGVIIGLRGQSQSGTRLLECRVRLLDAELEVGWGEPREHLPAAHRAAQVHEELVHAARDLERKGDLFFGRKRAAHADRAFERLLQGVRNRDGPPFGNRVAGGYRLRRPAARGGRRQREEPDRGDRRCAHGPVILPHCTRIGKQRRPHEYNKRHRSSE